jgi:hypothetical protein
MPRYEVPNQPALIPGVSELLSLVDEEWMAHDAAGQADLLCNRRHSFYEHIEAQGLLLVGLPERLSELQDAGFQISEIVAEHAEHCSGQAAQGMALLGSPEDQGIAGFLINRLNPRNEYYNLTPLGFMALTCARPEPEI